MSNVQVHCEQCDKSLYRLDDTTDSSVGVRLFTQTDTFGRDYPWWPHRHDFCDWLCAGYWAINKAVAE